jgi:DNA-binding LacI/PurR family transcriptional regulator
MALTETIRPAAWVLYRSTFEMQRWFSANALPAVITGTHHEGIKLPSVDTDYRAVCRHAAGQFLARRQQRLVLLNPETGTGGELESEQGFNEAVSLSTTADVQAVVVRHNGTVRGICSQLDALLRMTPAPTALLVSRPVHVLTTLGYLLRRGVQLPRDMALISRDDDSFLEHVVPSVARYASDPSAFARKLSKVVLALVQGGVLSAADHRLMPRFVGGDTLG